MECLGHRSGSLAAHGIQHEEGVLRRDGFGDAGDLSHHLLVDRQAARRVADEHISAETLGFFETARCRLHRVAAFAVDGDAGCVCQDSQLLHRRRALQVGAHEQRLSALLGEPAGQLHGVGGLA